MSVPDPANTYELAVAIGRVEESQKFIVKGLDDIVKAVAGQTEVVNNHTVLLSSLVTKVEAHDKILEEAKPLKSPWPVYAALSLSVFATVFGAVQAFIIGK